MFSLLYRYISVFTLGVIIAWFSGCHKLEKVQAIEAYDVLVVGATPGGIAAAVNAAREGVKVALVQSDNHIGGLASGGLSSPDFITFEGLSGTYLEFMYRIEEFYRDTYGPQSSQIINSVMGTYPEPHVARLVFERMLEEVDVAVFTNHELISISHQPLEGGTNRIIDATFVNIVSRDKIRFEARVFVDGTYEGDFLAAAGVPYRVGRESKHEYDEELAPESADLQVQAYNFRVVMTTETSNQVPVTRPQNYKRESYLPLISYIEENQIDNLEKISRNILRIRRMPNNKAEFNDVKFAPLSLSRTGINNDWPEGNSKKRKEIFEFYKDWSLGLIYFLQNDSDVPPAVREELSKWALPADEYQDTDNWSPALYVREGRRMVGKYVFTENDTKLAENSVRSILHHRSVAISDYMINTHGVFRSDEEGHFGDLGRGIPPIQIPYDVMLPDNVEGLIVPVAVSASHVGFAALRYEPTWMALGQAAGIAAALSIQQNLEIGDIDVQQLQLRLHELGAMTIYVNDVGQERHITQPEWEQPKDPLLVLIKNVPPTSPFFRPVQFWGTYGLFHHMIDPDTAVTVSTGPRIANKGSRRPYHSIDLHRKMTRALAEDWIKKVEDLGFSLALTVDEILESDMTRGEVLVLLFSLLGLTTRNYIIDDSVELDLFDADGISIGDISRNGKIDIIGSSGKGGETVWFEQGDNWKQWNRHHLFTLDREAKDIEGNVTGDINRDGWLEVVSVDQFNGNIYIHSSSNPKEYWYTQIIQGDRPFLQDARLIDVDEDGILDIVYTWQGTKKGEGGVHWLKFVGNDLMDSTSWKDYTMVTHEGAWWLGPHPEDLSGNGHSNDILFSAKNSPNRNPDSRPGIFWIEAPENVKDLWTLHTIDSTLYRPAHVDFGNFQGFGPGRDVIVGGFETNSLYWYEYGNNWKKHQIEIPMEAGEGVYYAWNVKSIPLGHFHDGILAPIVNESKKRGALCLFTFTDGHYRYQVLKAINYSHPMDDRILLVDLTGDNRPEIIIPDSGAGINTIHVLKLGQEGFYTKN